MAINWIESKVIDQIKWTDDLVSIRYLIIKGAT